MIVAAVARGSSFKGLAAYLGGAKDNDHRAVWSATQNIGTENIHMAARLMAATAMDADAIKRANGWDGRGRRTTKKPVYHWIMSWPEDMAPEPRHQEQAARELVKATGLEDAQALFVGHDDNGKTHVHIVVNLLNPETGKQFSLSNDQRKMQAWALAYCKANGIDTTEIAPNREKNAEARKRAKEKGLAPGETLDGTKRLSRAEWHRMRDALLDRQATERRALKKHHSEDWGFAKAKIRGQYRTHKAAFLKEHAHQKRIAKDRNRPYWRDLFQHQRIEGEKVRAAVEKAVAKHRRTHSLLGRVLSVLPFRKSREQAGADLALAKLKLADMIARHETERIHLGKLLAEQVFQRTLEALPKRKRVDLTDMKGRHAREWHELRERQQSERETAGIRSQSRRAAEKNGREASRDRNKRREELEGRVDPQVRRQMEERREREAAERAKDKDRDRER